MINLPDGDSRYVDESLGACSLCVDEVGIYEGTFTVLQYSHDDSGTDIVCTTNEIDRETIAATMSIPELNILEVDPEELNFGTVANELTFNVKNVGEGEMEWEASLSADVTWLTIEGGSSASGTVGTGLSEAVTLGVDRSKVDEGCVSEFSTSVSITSTNASPDEASVSVTMERMIVPPSPNTPTPSDGSIDQDLYATLKWQEGESQGDAGGAIYFDVYFSTNQALVESDGPSVIVCDDTEVSYCDPSKGAGQLDANTTYYWKVKAADNCQDNTIDSDVWSFTTGSAVESTCPASLILPLNNKEATALRGFRDEVLAKSLDGEKYINLYYSHHAIEALLILLFNPELRMCADRIVKESLPAIQSLLRREEAFVGPEIRADIELFLEEFGKDASPDLKRVISIIKKDIETGDLFEDLGFSAVR
jgi:hypothetical protein